MKDDEVELTVDELASLLNLKPRAVRGWIKPRNKNRIALPAYVPYGNRKEGYRVNVGDVRAFLDGLPLDQGHARRKFEEAWANRGKAS